MRQEAFSIKNPLNLKKRRQWKEKPLAFHVAVGMVKREVNIGRGGGNMLAIVNREMLVMREDLSRCYDGYRGEVAICCLVVCPVSVMNV
jgi:hypothetical protein